MPARRPSHRPALGGCSARRRWNRRRAPAGVGNGHTFTEPRTACTYRPRRPGRAIGRAHRRIRRRAARRPRGTCRRSRRRGSTDTTPVGIRPNKRQPGACRLRVTSYTATAFAPPSATYSVRPSGESARAVGARPIFRSRNGATASVAIDRVRPRVDDADGVGVAAGDVQTCARSRPRRAPWRVVRRSIVFVTRPLATSTRETVPPAGNAARVVRTALGARIAALFGGALAGLRLGSADVRHVRDRAVARQHGGERRDAERDDGECGAPVSGVEHRERVVRHRAARRQRVGRRACRVRRRQVRRP